MTTQSEKKIEEEKESCRMIVALRGEKHPHVKLTNNKVLQIRRLYKKGAYSQKELGRMFNISEVNVSRIVNHKLWKHI